MPSGNTLLDGSTLCVYDGDMHCETSPRADNRRRECASSPRRENDSANLLTAQLCKFLAKHKIRTMIKNKYHGGKIAGHRNSKRGSMWGVR